MSQSLREIKLKIGKGTYTIQTVLDGDTIERVSALISEVMGKVDEYNTTKEEALALTCLTLGWKLDKITRRLKVLAETMDKLK